MKKILVLTTTYPTFLSWDGTPPFVHELTKRLSATWLDMIVLTPRRPWTKTYEVQEWVTIYRYPYFFVSSWEKLADGAIMPNLKKNRLLFFQVPFLFVMCFLYTFICIKRHKIVCIHAHRIFINAFVWAVYKTFFNKKIRLLCTSHGSDLHSLHGWVIDTLKRWTIHRCDQVTVVSIYLKKQLDLLMWEVVNAEVIPMGVDEERFHPRYYEEQLKQQYAITWKLLLFVWRLAPEKWLFDILDAMSSIIVKHHDYTLLIVWDWTLREELEAVVIKKGLSKHIIFVWAIPNHELPKFYATADVLLALSRKESFWLVQVESIFSWTPVITTKWLGSDDIVIPWKNGFLIDLSVDDGVEKYVDNIFSFPLEKNMLRDSVQQFSWTNITKRYLPLL